MRILLLSGLVGPDWLSLCSASGDGCAKIYNLSLRGAPGDTSKMTSEIVWNAFYIHALLQHHSCDDSRLCIPHWAKQSDRIAAALEARNKHMIGIGQAEWAHACDDCEKILELDGLAAGGATYGVCLTIHCDTLC